MSIKLGSPLSLGGCSGVCSAKPGVEVGVNWMDNTWFRGADTKVEMHTSVGLGYSIYQVVVNGTTLDFESHAVNVGFQFRHKELPNFALATHVEMFGMAKTNNANNTSRQLDLATGGDVELLYNVSPAFQLSIGVATRAVPLLNSSPMMNTVNLGFNWMRP